MEDISAGLSIALSSTLTSYKGGHRGSRTHIVVQGGHNDAVLRAFELELKTTVVRPTIAGNGAYSSSPC